MNTKYEFIIWTDQTNSDTTQVEALSYDPAETPEAMIETEVWANKSVSGDEDDTAGENEPAKLETKEPPIAASDFVIIDDNEQQERQWFGQVIEPQRNLSQGLRREDPNQIGALRQVFQRGYKVSVFINQFYYYRIKLINEIENGQPRAVKRRPRSGSVGRKAQAVEVIQYMNLPEMKSQRDPENQELERNNIIGRVHNSLIPIPLDEKRIYYHSLIAGATGSGKTNTIGNVIKAALMQGMACIVFDHKPDYQDVDEPNDESSLFDLFTGNDFYPFKINNSNFFAPYNPSDDAGRDDETKIYISSNDVSNYMLGASLFYLPTEDLQREFFTTSFEIWGTGKSEQYKSIGAYKKEMEKWVKDKATKKLTELNDGVEPNEAVVGAVLRKLMPRKPAWLDFEPPKNRQGSTMRQTQQNTDSKSIYPDPFRPEDSMAAGRLTVIRIPDSGSGREYGLFLSYMLRRLYNLRRQNKINYPVCVIIDEAQDIFSGSKAVRENAEYAINEVLRKGRSKRLGFVISVQSSSEVPTSILQNLNSRIIHAQSSADELRYAIPGVPREMLNMALSFGPGEALVKLFNARSLVHAQMAPSPFKLTKETFD